MASNHNTFTRLLSSSLNLGFSEAFELNLDLFEPYLSLIETIL